ncbi:MAG TPA: LUD domain-containing protein [Opitutales bacterium]|nr:LUD domain-containing protein [Opitutales bacterium]
MSNAREDMLGRVNKALAILPERKPLPEWDTELAVARKLVENHDVLAVFSERIKIANAMAMTDPAAVAAFLKNGGWRHGYCDPALLPALRPAFGPEFTFETEFDRTRVDDFTFGITRAAGAIAETGTIILNDTVTSRRLGALTPWVHIAVVPRNLIHRTLEDAVRTFGDDPNVIWITGPSKTADIEGILIEGVHGPGIQIALVVS